MLAAINIITIVPLDIRPGLSVALINKFKLLKRMYRYIYFLIFRKNI